MFRYQRLLRFRDDRRANMAITLALALVPLILVIGVAVDLSRAYVVRSRMAYALDAAGLAVGSTQGSDALLQDTMEKFFYKNYPEVEMGTTMGLGMTIDSVNNRVQLSATVHLDTVFMKVVGIDSLDIAYSNEITREVKGLEVVLALDTTGSMASGGKIQGLRTASHDLVDILFGDQTAPEKLKVGLVPFATAVNIGPSNSGYVQWGQPQYAPWTGGDIIVRQDSYTGTTWKGCVRERVHAGGVHSAASPDVNDVYDGTTGVNGKWLPYYWPREPYSAWHTTEGNNYCSNRSNNVGVTAHKNVGETWESIDETAFDGNYGQSGPNKSCPRALLPLTNNRAIIEREIDALVPWGDDTGTIIHVGLSWAWRAISSGEPFTEGVPYGTSGWSKAIILLTDGDNTSISQNSKCDSENKGPKHSYTGYGYTTDERSLGVTSTSEAVRIENERLLETCTNIKALETDGKKDIVIYTIAFGTNVSRSAKSLLQSCASDTSKYFASPTSTELKSAFQQIAKELSKLRISK